MRSIVKGMLFLFILGSSMLLILLLSSSLAPKVTAINESLYNNGSESENIVKPSSPPSGYIDGGNNNEVTRSNANTLKFFSSFCPEYDFVKKIGKDKVDVSVMVPNGMEPHDFEPTAKQIIDLQKADFSNMYDNLNNLKIALECTN